MGTLVIPINTEGVLRAIQLLPFYYKPPIEREYGNNLRGYG